MHTIAANRFDSFDAIKNKLLAWQRRIASAISPRLADEVAKELDARMRYDIGLSDRRPLSPDSTRRWLPDGQSNIGGMLGR